MAVVEEDLGEAVEVVEEVEVDEVEVEEVHEVEVDKMEVDEVEVDEVEVDEQSFQLCLEGLRQIGGKIGAPWGHFSFK